MAQKALNTALKKKKPDNKVLYCLPCPQKWIFQLILSLILICHSSWFGVVELLTDLFGS
jgi:hypothetical protein